MNDKLSKAIPADQIDEVRALLTTLAMMVGVDIQGAVLDEAGQEFDDASVAAGDISEILKICANILLNRGSTEENIEKFRAKLPVVKQALARVGDLQNDVRV